MDSDGERPGNNYVVIICFTCPSCSTLASSKEAAAEVCNKSIELISVCLSIIGFS